MSSNRVTAVLLAAGRGQRIWPYGEVRQKCVVPVAGVPLVRRTADELVACGMSAIRVVTGHRAGSVRAALSGLDGSTVFCVQSELTGSADAALAALDREDFDTVLIVYGDVLVEREDLAAVFRLVHDDGAEAAALVAPLGEERPQDWLCAAVADGYVTGIQGHPRGGTHRLLGVYALRSSHMRFLRENPGLFTSVPVGGMPPVEAELAQSVQLMLDAGNEVGAVAATCPCVDLDKPWHILEANAAAVDALFARSEGNRIASSARIHDGAEIGGRLIAGENVHIGNRVVASGDLVVGAGSAVVNGAILGNRVCIGSDCRLRDYCSIGGHSVVGARGVVAHGAELGGVMFEGVYLYHYCEISGVLGNAVDIGAATVCGTLRFDDGRTVHRIRGRRETPPAGANASYLGDYCRTGVNAILMPGVKTGPYSCVGPGVILSRDLPGRKVILVKQDYDIKEWGPEKYGW